MRKRIAVARYNEDIGWLEPASSLGVSVTVYDKSDISITCPNGYRIVTPNHIMLPNIGREAHTYIKHIVDNYDSLYDIEIFTQGRVSDHVQDFWGMVRESENHQYLDFPHTEKIICLNEASYLKTNTENPRPDSWDRGSGAYVFAASDRSIELYEMVYGSVKETDNAHTKFSCHAVFSISKEMILRIPLETYQRMLDLFLKDPKQAHYWAYEFEYSWKLIFNGPFRYFPQEDPASK